MKSKILFTFVALLSSMMISCSKDDSSETDDRVNVEDITKLTPVATMSELTGQVGYNNVLKLWFISVHEAGTIDGVNCYYPTDLESTYKLENMKVVLSGMVYNMSESIKAKISLPAGTNCYWIDITEIKKDVVDAEKVPALRRRG